ncbi:peptidoglycan binding domain-containing protein [Kitasatospora sp. GP82]|uniref:peptidoglycan binding domain-containing protein n=1 Tax=Kitasatospora sp. GP82 TaxID=3035089 RepID=UPI002475069C|nr:peptidoglycan binding domain-containing protein [Kitasatospora sp. GP82]MDH6123228.1 hypothetical protein [Kitasatospora sp. GP82]
MSSRESDSAYPPRRPGGSPGRRPGEGPDVYPSGTPPYGTGLPNGVGPDPFGPAGPSAAEPGTTAGTPHTGEDDGPRTETTLTTRIRINIPGSRPIPPVVVRSPVKNEEAAPAEPTGPSGPRHRSGNPSSPVLGMIDPAARASTPPNLPPEWQNGRQQAEADAQGDSPESTGEWFRPRQRGRQQDAGPAQVGAGAGGVAGAAVAGGAAAAGAGARAPQDRMPLQERPMRAQGFQDPGMQGQALQGQDRQDRTAQNRAMQDRLRQDRAAQGLPAQERPGPGGTLGEAGARPSGAPASPFAAGQQPRQADAGFARDAGQSAAFGAGPGHRPEERPANDPYSATPHREAAPEPDSAQSYPAPGGRQAPADPFAGNRSAADPFAGGQAPTDPYRDNRAAAAPFAGGQADPFAGGQGAADPFAEGGLPADPFRTVAAAPRRQAAPRRSESATGPAAAMGEPEDTRIGGFDPIGEDAQTSAISGLPAANLFGSAPPAAPGSDPFAPGRPGSGPRDPSAADRTRPFANGQPTRGRFAESPAPFPGAPGAPGASGPQGASPVAGFPQAAVPAFEPAPQGAQDPKGSTPSKDSGGADEANGSKESKDSKPKTESPSTPAAKPRRGRVRKLATYAVGGLLFAGAAAYGTGLMLNQADIPKGTTVLGTDIGGDSRDQAVSALDSSVGKAGQQPLKLKLGDQTVDLDPATAGLSFDTTATVDGLTKHSYNPVEVIGSLAGGSKAVEPEVRVDRAKLKAALDSLSGKSSQGLQQGYVRFTSDGQTEVVPGKAGQAVDANAALDLIEQAYRDRAAGKPDAVVTVPVAAAQPKVTEDALKAAADSLGKSVLNGTVSVLAGTKKFDFGKVTASQALTLAPDDSGKVVLKWDLDKLNDALKKVAFDKVKIKKNGALVTITPQDVADGIASVIDKTAAKDRVYHFQTT